MKEILKDTSIYSLGNILTKCIGFFAIVFYTHFTTQEELGVYGYILVLISFASMFLMLGSDNAFARYYFEFKSNRSRQVLTSTVFFIIGIWTLFVVIVLILCSRNISYMLLESYEHSLSFLLALASLPFTIFASLSNQVLINNFKTKQFVIFNFATSVITISSAVILLKFSQLSIGAIFCGIIIANATLLPFRFYIIKELLIFKVSVKVIKKVLIFGIPFLPTSIAYYIFSSADRLMLEAMSSIDKVGLYTVAVSLSTVMNVISSAIGKSFSPHALKAYEEDRNKAKKLFAKFLYLIIFFVTIVIISATLIGRELIDLFFPATYGDVFITMLLLLIGIGFQTTTQVTALGITLTKKTIYLTYVTFFVAVFNIIMNYLLIPIYNEIGAAIATMLSFFVLTVLYYVTSQKLYKIRYNKLLFILSLFVIALAVYISYIGFYIRITLFIAIFILLFFKRRKIIEVFK